MRSKLLTLGGIAVAGAVALMAGSQTWVSFMLDGEHSVVTVTGHALNAALSPIAIAIVAAALALTIAGAIFRRVLGVLVMLLGAGVAALTATTLSTPLSAIAGRITELTGITGASTSSLVTWYDVSVWGWVSAGAGVLAALCGLIVLLTSGSWGTGGRKYESQRADAQPTGTPDRISDWDALSDGDDPTQGTDSP